MEEEQHAELREQADRYFDAIAQHLVVTHKSLRELEASRFTAANPEQQAELYVHGGVWVAVHASGANCAAADCVWRVVHMDDGPGTRNARRCWTKFTSRRPRWRRRWIDRCRHCVRTTM